MNELALIDGFVATPDRYLWHEPSATAIVADLHLGAEAELTRRGVFMPETSTAPLLAAWKRMCHRLAEAPRPRALLIAGDLFDVPMPDAAARSTARDLLKALPPKVSVTLLMGNHDPVPAVLREIFDGFDIKLADHATVGGYTVAHGHDLPKPLLTTGLIVGHQHPAVVLRDRVQSAKMICFACCTLRTQDSELRTILLPSFSRAPLGSNLLTERHWIIDAPRPDDADVRIAGIITPSEPASASVLDFGPLSGLRLPF